MNIYEEIELDRVSKIKPLSLNHLLRVAKITAPVVQRNKSTGTYSGKKIPQEIVEQVQGMALKGVPRIEIEKECGISKYSVNKIKMDMRAEGIEVPGMRVDTRVAEKIASVKKMRNEGCSLSEIAKRHYVSTTTIKRYLDKPC